MKKRGSNMCVGVLYDLNDLPIFLTQPESEVICPTGTGRTSHAELSLSLRTAATFHGLLIAKRR